MPKSTKRLILTDESFNDKGFITLTDGVTLDRFNKNPLMLWMHHRATKGVKDEVLPLGYWDDVEVSDGVISAVPVFDDNDPFAMSIYHKVENGTLRAASAALIPQEFELMSVGDLLLRTGRNPAVALAVDDDVPVLSKSILREASIVDIGSNHNAVVLYSEEDQVIELNDISTVINLYSKTNSTPPAMELKELAQVLNLSADAQLPAIILAAKKKSEDLKNANELVAAKTEEIKNLKAEAVKKEVDTFLDNAVKEGRIVEKEKEGFVKLAAADFDAVKEIVNARPAHESVEGKFGKTPNDTMYVKLSGMTFDQIDKAGLQAELKKHPELYKEKYKAEFGIEPK